MPSPPNLPTPWVGVGSGGIERLCKGDSIRYIEKYCVSTKKYMYFRNKKVSSKNKGACRKGTTKLLSNSNACREG